MSIIIFLLIQSLTYRKIDHRNNKSNNLFQALVDENLDPEEHVFFLEVGSPKKRLNSSQKSDNTNGDESFILEASGEEGLDTDDLIVKDEADDDDEIVDEVGEIDKESFEDELEKSSSEVQRERLNIEANNGDNEDSLNLTIGEDEEKIFQDEVCVGVVIFITESVTLSRNDDRIFFFIKIYILMLMSSANYSLNI